MTILRHPSLPEVEPKPLRFTFGCKFVAESFPSLPRITGPLGDDEEDAAQKWNDWVRPLVELQAQHDRWLQLSKDYGERVESLEDDVSALTAERDKLDADLTAANARADALLAELNEASPEQACARCGTVSRWHKMVIEEGDEWECWPCHERINAEEAKLRAALNDQPEQPT